MKTAAKNQRVLVGMSGGVDSSVAAALLKRRGYDVVGAFIKVWQPDFLPCSWPAERREAMRAAAHLGIPFVTVDLSAEYEREVVGYMLAEYRAGRTPNPDVMCNRRIKFGGFLRYATEHGFDRIATGHYARVKALKSGSYHLLAGTDEEKDQSYFLWTLTQDQLCRATFPIGDLQKAEVRHLAKKIGLPNAEKKDSQGLCFIGQVEMRDFLKRYTRPRPGDIVDAAGKKIGQHDGALLYTIGQRHGLEVTRKRSGDKPYYVVAKDAGKNTVTVARRQSLAAKRKTSAKLEDVNWIGDVPKKGSRARVRVRYLQPLQGCSIATLGKSGTATIHLDQPQLLAAGQSVVLYRGRRCLGGGVISG